jgi:glutamate/tyrosine decarboxylase-like PLP-dependent enzyme
MERSMLQIVEDNTRKYEYFLDSLRTKYFLAPDGDNKEELLSLLRGAVDVALDGQGQGPTYQRTSPPLPFEDVAKTAFLPDNLTANPFDVLPSLTKELEGLVNTNHVRMHKNVIPLPAWTYFAGNLAASLYMPNGVTSEYAGNAVNAEIAVAKVYAELAGYDSSQSGGLFTFGGTGTNLYAFKMGVSKADPDFIFDGSKGNLVIVGSKPSHYAQQNATNWLGLGRNNYLMARSNLDQTTDIADMERICEEQIRAGKRIACIVGVGGTTSNMGIDNFEDISEMRDRLVAKYALDYTPHIHSDSVIGWSYLHFADYAFQQNPLGFSKNVLKKIQRTTELAKTFRFADSFGLDFHKTGYVPYVSSMVVARKREDLSNLGRESQMMTPLFFDPDDYHPGKYSLETSRSAANMVGTWLTVKALGKQGYQVLLGHAQEMAQLVRDRINEKSSETGLYVVNQESFGSDVYVRCFPPGITPSQAHARELCDAEALAKTNAYNSDFYDWLQAHHVEGKEGFSMGKTSAAFYTPSGEGVTTLRLYILNPFMDRENTAELVDQIVRAKHGFDQQTMMREPERHLAGTKPRTQGIACG